MFRFANLLKNGTKIFPFITIPILIHKKYQSFFFNSGPSTNKINQRFYSDVQISNHPCEDRSDHIQLTAIDGYAAAVYDGHGGWQVSHYCSKHLLKALDQSLKELKDKIDDRDQLIKRAIVQAFRKVQTQFLTAARIGYKMGFGRFARAGSCALISVVHNNKVYTGNTGDSLGLLVQQTEKGQMIYTQINKQQNANHQQERNRLKAKFPLQEDIVICKKQNFRSCYVKGRLQPTRTLGDLRLKHSQFNNPQNYPTQNDYQSPLKVFTGPYIDWQPQIMTFQIDKSFKYLVMASDGLWDQLGRQQVAEHMKNKKSKDIPQILINQALIKAAQAGNTTVQKLKNIPRGKKRKLHDDITVVLLDLQNQAK